jgi:ribose transport system ATP-binding protein
MGAGRTELAKTLIGHYKKDQGTIKVYDLEVDLSSPEKAIESGLVYVSEDRKGDGLVLGMSVRENISLSSLAAISNGWGHLNMQKEKQSADSFVNDMSIKTPSINQKVRNLSGGNQQKVSIAKSLMTNPKVLILDEPTRGVDVGAKKEIYELINHFKQEGMSILMISSEIPEIIGMCDRVLVMHEGNMTGELELAQITQDNIMRLAVGMTEVRS